jgi:ABC-type uncharacterized transport system substrate-binding protein
MWQGVDRGPKRAAARRLAPALLLAGLAIFAPAAHAIHSGHIQGRILDEFGKPISGALVTISGEEAVGIWKCETDETGFYRIAGLDASRNLDVRVEAKNRATLLRGGYRLRDDQTLHLDFRLKPEGVFHTLVILDARVPYHRTALAGARGTLPPGVKVLEVKNHYPRTIRKLRRVLGSRPDGVLAIGSLAARLARHTTFDIPVVYTLVLDPAKEQLLVDNMCGIPANGAFSEQLDILFQMAPEVKRVGTLFDPGRIPAVARQLRMEAEGAGYILESRAVHEIESVPQNLASLKESGIEAFILLLDPGLWTNQTFDTVRSYAQEHDLILIVPDGAMVRAGATFSYAPGFSELGAYAGRLLINVMSREASVTDIGVIYPTTRYFSVNPQDMDRFGLKMPTSIGGDVLDGSGMILSPAD